MPNRLKPLLLLAAGLAVFLGILWTSLRWWQSSREFEGLRLSETLPRESGAILFLDLKALRSSGLLEAFAKSKSAEDPDYKRFIDETGFDYARDLDSLAASFVNGDTFAAIQGTFEWKRLSAYALAHGGSCQDSLCSLPATQPERFISYYPLRTHVLALAVSRDRQAANHIDPPHGTSVFHATAPVAISAPGFEFESGKALPAGAQAFLSPLARSTRSSFYAQSAANQNFELRLDAECPTQNVAEDIAKRLQQTTYLLKNMLARDKMHPREDDLSGLLVSGTFQSKNSHVSGTWPLNRKFVNGLLAGGR